MFPIEFESSGLLSIQNRSLPLNTIFYNGAPTRAFQPQRPQERFIIGGGCQLSL